MRAFFVFALVGAVAVGCSSDPAAPADGGVDASLEPDGAAPKDDAASPTDAAPSDAASADGGGDAGPLVAIGAGPYAIVYSSGPGIGIDQRPSVTAMFSGTGMDGYTAGAEEAPTRGTATVAKGYMDPFSAAGRWAGGTSAGTYYTSPPFTWNAQQGFHYGIVVAAGQFPNNVPVPYDLASATEATIEDGSLVPGAATGKATVAYGANGATDRKLGLEITVTMPGDATYTATTVGGATTPATSGLTTFNASHAGNLDVTGGGAACGGSGACRMNVRAMIGGGGSNTGARVAVAYVISSGTAAKAIRGVVLLKSQ